LYRLKDHVRFAKALGAAAHFAPFCLLTLMRLLSMGAEASASEVCLALDPTPNRTVANANAIDAVRQEVLNPATLAAIAFAHSFQVTAVKDIEVSCSPDGAAVVVRQAADSNPVFGVVVEELRWYVRGRAGGHSAPFLLGCLTNRSWATAKSR
jgi:hypothetical protein